MDTTIPYHPGLLLGRSVDMKSVREGFMLTGEEITPTAPQVNLTTHQYSFINTLKDVCEVLSIPPEYVLKVKSGKVKNEVVEASLKHLGEEDSFTIIFRSCFLQQKHYLPEGAVAVPGKPSQGDSGESRPSTESLIADAAMDSEPGLPTNSSLSSFQGTHWVKAVEFGNELIVVMRISSQDLEKVAKLRYKMGESLQSFRGLFDEGKLDALQKAAADIDKKLDKKHYGDVHLDIQYGCFHELSKYPASMSGMVKTIENFMDQCTGWSQTNKHGPLREMEHCVMICKDGIDKEEKSSLSDALMKKFQNFHFGSGSSGAQPVAYHPSKEAHGELDNQDEDEDHESFVVLDPSVANCCYTLRVTLQSFQEETGQEPDRSFSSLAISQYPEETYQLFEGLHKALTSCNEAVKRIQWFLSSKRFLLENRVEECNQVLKQIQEVHMKVLEAVNKLDFVCIPGEEDVAEVIALDPLKTVNEYIENVTSKLPPGSDLDLLMIGKTGHGKSSTGNSILGHERFVSSASGDSVTTRTNVGWTEIDGRTIKVVDTPGVCDTNVDTDASSVDLAIQSISDAIANCPDGFHALLLIIRFGIRMTNEEKKAIGLLKCVLGEDIVKSHVVCVITHGDNFETEMAHSGKKMNFATWCKQQSGFLKDLFEECGYRCVLFNNKATDPKAKKAQLIQLVAKVDGLKDHGTRYTNAIFEFAQRERKRIVSEEQVPQVNEDMVRDIQLILEYLNTMVSNTDEQSQYKDELANLRERVDNLSNRVSEAENGQLGTLVDTVFSLAATIHARMDEIADRPEPDKPDLPEGACGATGSGGAGDDLTIAKRAESPFNFDDLNRHRGELQHYYDNEVSPHVSMVNHQVAEKVKTEVQKEKCFPGSSTVVLANGKSTTLDKLQIGDKVLVRNASGQPTYDTVYMFGHQDFEGETEFLVLNTAMHSVCVTKGHYVYCIRNDKELCVAAENVKVGDCLLVSSIEGLVPQPVETILYQRMKGMFAPFTHSGTIVIDNVLMSCYVDVLEPGTCHTLLWPVRQLSRLSPRALAFVNGTSSQHPVPRWAKAAMKLM